MGIQINNPNQFSTTPLVVPTSGTPTYSGTTQASGDVAIDPVGNVGYLLTSTTWAPETTYGFDQMQDPSAMEPLDYRSAGAGVTAAAGTAFFMIGRAPRTLTVSNIVSATAGTAMSGASAAYCGLYSVAAPPWTSSSPALTQMSVSADVHTTLWAGLNTAYVVALGSSQTITAGSYYAVALLEVGAGTAPVIRGIAQGCAAALNDNNWYRALQLTGQSTLQSSYSTGALGTSANMPWAKVR